ncbi:MAG: MBG domain-containing protein [Candidatus Paceibacterota bacterium]
MRNFIFTSRFILLFFLVVGFFFVGPSAAFANKTVTITKNGTGTGTVNSTLPNSTINCGATCSASFSNTATVNLTATPSVGSKIEGWNVPAGYVINSGCGSSDLFCNFRMNNTAKTITTTFNLKENQETVAVTGLPSSATYQQAGITASGSGGSGTGTFSYSAGASTACSVNPSTGAVTITSGNGTCTITATREADNNYNVASGSASITTINKADANISITPYSVAYDATTHTATGTATGVLGEDLAGLDVSCTIHTNAGDYTTDPWTFTDSTGNYNNASGTVSDAITKIDAIINVSGYTGTYDGDSHGATGTATGIGDVDLSSSINLGSTFTDVPGGTANWIFAGGENYNNANGNVSIAITAQDITVTADAKSKIYGSSDPALTFTNDPLVEGDSFSGALARDAGETVGIYPITQGTLSLNENYTLNFTGANFTVAQHKKGGSYTIPPGRMLSVSREPIPGCGNRTTGFSITTGKSCIGNTGEGQVLGAKKFIFLKNMKIGSKLDPDVKELQSVLTTLGYYSGPIDGKFGPGTKAAVIKFQLANGLKGDGRVGALTRAVLNK